MINYNLVVKQGRWGEYRYSVTHFAPITSYRYEKLKKILVLSYVGYLIHTHMDEYEGSRHTQEG